jgi:hypothetical protein
VKTALRLALVAALAAPSAPLAAQAVPGGDLPAPESLVARYVEAIGGRAAVERFPSRWERGRAELPAQGITFVWESLTGGGRLATRSEMPGLGTVRTGFDGEVAWSINPAAGPMILEGKAAQQMRQAADPLAALHPDRYVASMRTVEETDFAGARCYRVRVTTPWGESYDELFDKATGLLKGGTRQQASPQGDIAITSEIAEYRTVAGVRLPRVTRARMMGMELVTTVDSTELRSVPDSALSAPPEIRALRHAP